MEGDSVTLNITEIISPVTCLTSHSHSFPVTPLLIGHTWNHLPAPHISTCTPLSQRLVSRSQGWEYLPVSAHLSWMDGWMDGRISGNKAKEDYTRDKAWNLILLYASTFLISPPFMPFRWKPLSSFNKNLVYSSLPLPTIPDGRFRDRLKLDNQTGSLTITNITAEHVGVYKLDISGANLTSKTCSVFVYGE
ncbi:hypothetical protein H4Q32_030703 [Labeo rohita]|uniref:Immunoglobulin V-set domain-containing protein n=1 Tax=Labeo rohita TaxID=84645 RepID=A0ABQ8L8K5_LABRO|nr:hypothetical protein H4Q32_030703 [Labeo rohita]